MSGLEAGDAPRLGLAVMRGLQAKAADLEHENAELRALVAALRHLVGEAFAEGFRARAPESDEPWLADWLGSGARARLEALRGAVHRHGPHDAPATKDADNTQEHPR